MERAGSFDSRTRTTAMAAGSGPSVARAPLPVIRACVPIVYDKQRTILEERHVFGF